MPAQKVPARQAAQKFQVQEGALPVCRFGQKNKISGLSMGTVLHPLEKSVTSSPKNYQLKWVQEETMDSQL
jgi:hypothetical protein